MYQPCLVGEKIPIEKSDKCHQTSLIINNSSRTTFWYTHFMPQINTLCAPS